IGLCVVSVISLGGCQQRPATSAEQASSPASTNSASTDTTNSVTFSRDVAPIVFQKCASCHHPGEAGPFSLLTYDDVRHRAQQIVDVTQKRFMPPWLPSGDHDEFLGDRRLTDHELQILKQWVDAGTPRGNDSEMPAAPTFTAGWQTGTPDLVLESPAYVL